MKDVKNENSEASLDFQLQDSFISLTKQTDRPTDEGNDTLTVAHPYYVMPLISVTVASLMLVYYLQHNN